MRTTLFALATVLAFSSMAQDDLADGLYARFQTTKGTITLKLEFEKTPLTVANFVGLAEGTKKFEAQGREAGKPYYDGLGFHRVIADFMIQGGCPLGTGTGGPGYRFVDEIDPTLKHVGPGILSMANSGPNTNGSQFFVTLAPCPFLDGKHTVFGRISSGMQVIQRMDPPGVGARDQNEMLLLQITDRMPFYEVMRVLVRDHLEDIAFNRLPIIQKATGYSIDMIKVGIEQIQTLNPWPGRGCSMPRLSRGDAVPSW